MNRLLALIFASFGSWVGWWLGAHVGFFTGVILSMVGMGVGLYGASRITQYYFG